MVGTAEIHALVITPDVWLATSFTTILKELGVVDVQRSARTDGVPAELGRAKFEAVLLDFDVVSEARLILSKVRESPANKNALIFAVATERSVRQHALQEGAHFILKRPFEEGELRKALHAGYGLMARERRRYFRCSAEIRVLLTRAKSQADVTCATINISSGGMALQTPFPLNPGDEVGVVLFLRQAGPTVRGNGTVVWDDKHGKAGIRFRCQMPQDQDELEAWLDKRFSSLLPPSHPSL